jgi:hypothetical protein
LQIILSDHGLKSNHIGPNFIGQDLQPYPPNRIMAATLSWLGGFVSQARALINFLKVPSSKHHGHD